MSNTDIILSTGRLDIRQLILADAEFVVRLLNDESFLRHIGDKGVRTIADAHNYLRQGPMACYRERGFGLYHVAEKSSGQAIGICGLVSRLDQEYPDIGFAFLAEFQGQGYAKESAAAVMHYGLTKLSIPTIVAFVGPENSRSIRLLQRLGLNFVGKTRVAGVGMMQSKYSSSPHEGGRA